MLLKKGKIFCCFLCQHLNWKPLIVLWIYSWERLYLENFVKILSLFVGVFLTHFKAIETFPLLLVYLVFSNLNMWLFAFLTLFCFILFVWLLSLGGLLSSKEEWEGKQSGWEEKLQVARYSGRCSGRRGNCGWNMLYQRRIYCQLKNLNRKCLASIHLYGRHLMMKLILEVRKL